MSVSNVRVDASSLKRLARGLGDLREDIADRLIRSSFKDALRSATPEAKRRTVHRGGFDLAKPSLSSRVRAGIKGQMTGVMQGEIKSVNRWTSMANWMSRPNPQANYTSKSFNSYPAIGPGVTARGVFRQNVALTSKRYGFVRNLNGNIHVIGGDGRGWHKNRRWTRGDKTNAKISTVFHGPNPSAVLLHKAVSDPVGAKFYEVMDRRFVSKYNGAIDRIKASHGL